MLTPQQLTQLHRRQQLALRKVTLDEMSALWPALDWQKLDSTYPRFAAEVGAMVARNRRTSAGLSAAYLRAFRTAAGLDGDLRVIIPKLAPEQLATSLRVTSVVAAKKAAAAGQAPDVAMGHTFSQVSGAMARLVLNAGRETVAASTVADPRARGWQRVLGSGGCDFCRMLIDRGAVYGEESASFEAHDKCGCTAEPVY